MSSVKNLSLAWTRIKTAQNVYYKNYYRNILLAYELRSEENLRILSKRLLAGSGVMGRDVLHLFHLKNSGKIYIGEDKGPALEFRILADEFSAFRHHKKPVHTICRNSFGKFIK